jgi:hypothetical protein
MCQFLLNGDIIDAGFDGQQSAKDVMLSLFDGLEENAIHIDLWTNKMQLE